MTVSVLPHAANPLDAELYTAAVCRPRSPGRTVQSNAPVNQQLLLHQHARETRAGWAWYTASVTDGYLNVQTHTTDDWWAAADTPAERAAEKGSEGVTGRVRGRDASDKTPQV